ncbi:MAG: hypothetical protein LBJ22_07795 [Synergistaceae bacterium]|nr:hypothetical protein [Synergistaceae bacterium]
MDADFNADIQTGHDGILRGAIEGHPDTAAAKLAVIV